MKKNLFSSKKFIIPIIALVFLIFIIIVTIVIINKNSKQATQPIPNSDINSTDNNSEETSTKIEQNIYSVKDYDLSQENQNKIIRSVEELKNYLTSTYSEDNLEKLTSKYTDDFFAERALALSYVKLSNNKQLPNIDSLNINENSLEIGYTIQESEKENNSNCYIILVETDKTIEAVTSVQPQN